jgi:hypothetical protein
MQPLQREAGVHHDASHAPPRFSKIDDNNQSKSFVWIEEEDVFFFVFSATAYRLFFNENNQKS